MRFFVNQLLLPFLEGNGYKRLCEIGAHQGKATRKLLGLSGVSVCTIDPCLDRDLEEAFGEDGRVDVRKGTSLEVLPTLEGEYDCFLIDGDHNWYTVFHELCTIEKKKLLRKGGAIVLHDVAWPYARRDMYYQPELIPAEYVHPHTKQGIVKGQSALAATSTYLAGLSNAEFEGGPRNGVLTAIEDFIEQSPQRYLFMKCNVEYGLGVLVLQAEGQGFLYLARWRLLFFRFALKKKLIAGYRKTAERMENNSPGAYGLLRRAKRLVTGSGARGKGAGQNLAKERRPSQP